MPRQLQKFSLQPHNSTGVDPGGQGVEPPISENLGPGLVVFSIIVRLG
jgi:hypothetical protein